VQLHAPQGCCLLVAPALPVYGIWAIKTTDLYIKALMYENRDLTNVDVETIDDKHFGKLQAFDSAHWLGFAGVFLNTMVAVTRIKDDSYETWYEH